jgi:pimeloyl-ACP methyl ester carboxylesterase
MATVQSKDGTTIAYEKSGNGPAVILVDGAMCWRDSGPARPLAKLLEDQFTVYTYDRRGRGESTDTQPYTVEREVEDLEALINAAGGSAFVYGISSGAVLALEAATCNLPIKKLALYEAPLIVEDSRDPLPADYVAKMHEYKAAGRYGDMVRMFMKVVQVPAFFIFLMSIMPAWKNMTKVAPTLPYDTALTAPYQQGKPLPQDRWHASMPTFVADGGKSPAWMRNANRSLAETIHAEYLTLDGQTHMLKPEAIAPVLKEFFSN